MLNKSIAICLIAILGNAVGVKLHSHYTELAVSTGSKITASVGGAAPNIR